MSKKVFNLVTGVVTGVEAIALAVCTFAIPDPFIKGAVVASIPVVCNAGIAVCNNFVKDEA
jgi:hypothetical protein